MSRTAWPCSEWRTISLATGARVAAAGTARRRSARPPRRRRGGPARRSAACARSRRSGGGRPRARRRRGAAAGARAARRWCAGDGHVRCSDFAAPPASSCRRSRARAGFRAQLELPSMLGSGGLVMIATSSLGDGASLAAARRKGRSTTWSHLLRAPSSARLLPLHALRLRAHARRAPSALTDCPACGGEEFVRASLFSTERLGRRATAHRARGDAVRARARRPAGAARRGARGGSSSRASTSATTRAASCGPWR